VTRSEALAKIDWDLYEAAIYAGANTPGLTQIQFNGAWRPRPSTMLDYRNSLPQNSAARTEYDRLFRLSGLPQTYRWSRLHTEGVGMDIRQLNGVGVATNAVVDLQSTFLRQLRLFNNGASVPRIIAPNEVFGILPGNRATSNGFRVNAGVTTTERGHRDHIHYGN
jgi:hypothetical protein